MTNNHPDNPSNYVDAQPSPTWKMKLYVAGQTPKSLTAFANLKKICDDFLHGEYSIEVIDLSKHPHLAEKYNIVALPTLVRQLPEPIKQIIGDLSDTQKVLIGLQIVSVNQQK